jgi:phosphopantothenoylcysteine decarboxylase/phosphopantothenate--cysteine ligase
MLLGKKILLIIGGGIAAYRSLELIRRLRERGAQVTPVLTRAGTEFVTPLSAGALSGSKVYQDLFDLTDEAEMGHIELSRSADLLVVAPATADLMAKMVSGQANDLASTLLLATDKRVLVAPSMNVRMWEHAATQRNVAQLLADGVLVVGPNDGAMACGEFGPGRMAEPDQIADRVEAALHDGPLRDRHVLITSGPTHEAIDPVRYIANRSSGAMGAAIAQAVAALGADVTFVTGPAEADLPLGVKIVQVQSADEMLAAVQQALPADVAVFAAAVADWKVRSSGTSKIKKSLDGSIPEFELTENPDILASVAQLATGRPSLVVGFAAETDDVVKNATAKRLRKGCDWIVANDVSAETGIMGGSENAVTLITDDKTETWPRASKVQVGRQLADEIAKALT